MELVTLAVVGAIMWVAVWIAITLINTVLYGALTCATGYAGLYIGSCVESASLFQFDGMSVGSKRDCCNSSSVWFVPLRWKVFLRSQRSGVETHGPFNRG